MTTNLNSNFPDGYTLTITAPTGDFTIQVGDGYTFNIGVVNASGTLVDGYQISIGNSYTTVHNLALTSSSSFPATAGSLAAYMVVNINGTYYKIPIYNYS